MTLGLATEFIWKDLKNTPILMLHYSLYKFLTNLCRKIWSTFEICRKLFWATSDWIVNLFFILVGQVVWITANLWSKMSKKDITDLQIDGLNSKHNTILRSYNLYISNSSTWSLSTFKHVTLFLPFYNTRSKLS